MTGHLSERTRWAIVMAFAIAMAWVEAASVFYIRALVDRIEPYQADPLPLETMSGALGPVELWREAATLVMIATLGVLAGRTWRRRAGYAALAFGAWDIFYYVFLRLISGWPRTLLDWDILFLLPLPWWGPVLAPVSIASMMIVWGTLATQSDDAATDARWAWALGWVGIVLALAVFMIDAGRALPHGRDAVLQVLPTTFNWPLFWVALLLMASPALHQIHHARARIRPRVDDVEELKQHERRKCHRQRVAEVTAAIDEAPGERVRSISDRGQMAGEFIDANSRNHGLVMENGVVTTIDVPGATTTTVLKINNRGQMVGVYSDNTAVHGILLSNGTFSEITAPGSLA